MPDTPPPDRTLRLPLALVTLAFVAVTLPLYGAVMWAAIIALVFLPLQQRLVRRFAGRQGWAALATLAVATGAVIVPLLVLASSLARQAARLAEALQSGRLSPLPALQRVLDILPAPLHALLQRYGLADVDSIRQQAEQALGQTAQQLAGHALSFGQLTLDFSVSLLVALYVAFFFLRDGPALSRRIWAAVPLREHDKRALRHRFTAVVRATVKGNLVVAAIQGALGGAALAVLGFPGALLWGAVMAALSLLPAVGAALVWGPIAIYLATSGQLAQGLGLALFGTLVIGLVDNLLRPRLVGRDTRLPDWLVLVSTLGGIALLGINGFVVGPVVAAMFVTLWGLHAGEAEGRPH